MAKLELQPLILYWLEEFETTNATTGKKVKRAPGPFVVASHGCGYRAMSDDEVVEYVEKLHGCKPSKIERKEK
jgi:hypothetical protein